MITNRKAGLRYAVEGAVSLFLIGVFQELSRRLGATIAEPTLHTAVGLLPIIPIGLFGLVGLRLYRAFDEMQRREIVLGVAGGAWLSLLVNMTYRYLPAADLPPLPQGAPVLIVCVFIVFVAAALRNSLTEMRNRE